MKTITSTPNAKKGMLSAVLAGIAGNVLEWYDFAVYGFFAPILGKPIFPSKDPTPSPIASFGAFAASFLIRPVGAAVFGQSNDHQQIKSLK